MQRHRRPQNKTRKTWSHEISVGWHHHKKSTTHLGSYCTPIIPSHLRRRFVFVSLRPGPVVSQVRTQHVTNTTLFVLFVSLSCPFLPATPAAMPPCIPAHQNTLSPLFFCQFVSAPQSLFSRILSPLTTPLSLCFPQGECPSRGHFSSCVLMLVSSGCMSHPIFFLKATASDSASPHRRYCAPSCGSSGLNSCPGVFHFCSSPILVRSLSVSPFYVLTLFRHPHSTPCPSAPFQHLRRVSHQVLVQS